MKECFRGPFEHIQEIPDQVEPWNAVLRGYRPPSSTPISARVAVVGSGITSAVLAYELGRAGAEVDVYEAEERLGGRIHTIHFPDEQYGELGAMRVPSNHTAVIEYIKELGLQTRPFVNWNSEGTIYFGGKYLKVMPIEGPSERHYHKVKSVFPNIRHEFYTQIASGVSSAFQSLIVDRIFDHFQNQTDPIDVLLSPDKRNEKIKTLMETNLADFATGPICNLLDDEWFLLSRVSGMAAFNTCPVQQFILGMLPVLDSGEIVEVVGGMAELTDRLFALSRSTEIFSQARVISLERKVDKVTLSFLDIKSSQVTSMEYDHVVVTVPPKSLEHVEILSDPDALEAKIAVQELTIRPLLKILLNFEQSFWGERQGLIPTDLPVSQVWYPSHREEQTEQNSNVLIAAYRWADLAVEWMDIPNETLIEIALSSLSELHGIDVSQLNSMLEDAVVVKWPEAYTLLEMDKFDKLYDIIDRDSETSCIHFSGEHMSLLHGWMISSVMPAQQIAARIIRRSST